MEPKFYLPVLELKNLDDFISRANDTIYYAFDFSKDKLPYEIKSFQTRPSVYLTALNKDKDILISYILLHMRTNIYIEQIGQVDFLNQIHVCHLNQLKRILSESYNKLQLPQHNFVDGVLKNTN